MHRQAHLRGEGLLGADDPFLDRAADFNGPGFQGSLSRTNVVPLSLLKRWPATVECPACRELTHTNARVKTGHGTHWMATLLFFTTGLGVIIPYVTNFSKNVHHYCFRCGKKLVTHHFGSGTETHLI